MASYRTMGSLSISVNSCRMFPRLLKFTDFAALKRNFMSSQYAAASAKNSAALNISDALRLAGIKEKFNLLQPGHKVLVIGAAPGSRSKFLAKKTNADEKDANSPVGKVVAVDLKNIRSYKGVHRLPNLDFFKEPSRKQILEVLGEGEKFDFIFSNVSPPATGVSSADKKRMVKLVFLLQLFFEKHLKEGGNCLMKLKGLQRIDLQGTTGKLFKKVHTLEVLGTDSPTPVTLIVGQNFLGGKL